MELKQFQARSRRLFIAAVAAVLLVLAHVLLDQIRLAAKGGQVEIHWDAGVIAVTLVMNVIVIAVIVLCLRMLREVSGGAAPFSMSNVKRLRAIGWLLVTFEPLQQGLTYLVWLIRSGRVQDGETVTYFFQSMGGMILLTGLVVLGLALAFEYGAQLQKLSDETL